MGESQDLLVHYPRHSGKPWMEISIHYQVPHTWQCKRRGIQSAVPIFDVHRPLLWHSGKIKGNSNVLPHDWKFSSSFCSVMRHWNSNSTWIKGPDSKKLTASSGGSLQGGNTLENSLNFFIIINNLKPSPLIYKGLERRTDWSESLVTDCMTNSSLIHRESFYRQACYGLPGIQREGEIQPAVKIHSLPGLRM